jgi:hypothetical protein
MSTTSGDIVRATYYSVKDEMCQGFSYSISYDDAIALPTRTGGFQILGGSMRMLQSLAGAITAADRRKVEEETGWPSRPNGRPVHAFTNLVAFRGRTFIILIPRPRT